jgi:hypothetical protein
MQITQELVTVLADAQAGEITIVLAGYRIVLSTEEATQLARGLASGFERLVGPAASEPATATEPAVGADPWRLDRAPSAAEGMQQRTRALIQATMREKGLALREEGGG